VIWYQQRGLAPSATSGPSGIERHVADAIAVPDAARARELDERAMAGQGTAADALGKPGHRVAGVLLPTAARAARIARARRTRGRATAPRAA
jgi:hypothetical protein